MLVRDYMPFIRLDFLKDSFSWQTMQSNYVGT